MMVPAQMKRNARMMCIWQATTVEAITARSDDGLRETKGHREAKSKVETSGDESSSHMIHMTP